MTSKLCCLGSFFKHHGKYYPRKTEPAPDLIPDLLEQTTWQDSQHDEAEYPYEWLKSAATQKYCRGRGRRRRFFSRIRTIHAVDDTGIAEPEDFTFNSIVANEDLSGKRSDVTESVSEPAVGFEVTEDKNDVALETVKSRTMGIDNVDFENTKEQDTNIPPALKDAAVDAKEKSPTSLQEEVTGKGKQNISEKENPCSSEKHEVDVSQDKNISEKLLENGQQCADTTAASPSLASPPCSASALAKSPISNTKKDTSCDQDPSKVNQTHQQSEQEIEGGEREEERPPVDERDNVRDHARLDMERQEQRMQDWIRRNRTAAPSGPSLRLIDRTSLNHPSQQRQNQEQRDVNQFLILHNEQVEDHLTSHHRPQPQLPLGLPQQHRQRSQSERRGSQPAHGYQQEFVHDMDEVVLHMHLHHRQGRARGDGAEQGDRLHEREEERRQRHLLRQQHHLRALGLAGEVGTVRNSAEHTRENIVRELRQQAHRPDHREGYVSRVGAIVRQRHSQQEQNADGHPGPQPHNPPPPPPPPPPELERRVRPIEMERVQRLNPQPPRRRRRCQKRAVFQPKKE